MRLNNKLFGIIIVFMALFVSCNPDITINTGIEPDDPDTFDADLWKTVDKGLNGGFGSTDIRYSRSIPPQSSITDSIELTGWRGEKVNAQLVYWSRSKEGRSYIELNNLTGTSGTILSANISAGTVKYVLTDEFMGGCGYRDGDTIPLHLSADLIDSTDIFYLPGYQSRPVWVSVDIPEETNPGTYRGKIVTYSQNDTLVSSLTLTVQDMILPSPANWKFHLDLWQNPYAVARYHNVREWSQEHIDLMKPLLKMLAGAGQKCITTTLNDKPWGGQTYDPFGQMITWIRNSDGTWDYDYAIFDQYVNLAMECGITDQINCYSMVPWGNMVKWYDEDSGSFVTEEIIPGSEKYKDLWRPFLLDFRTHLMELGWLDITYLALDERGEIEMEKMFSFLSDIAPEFRIAMAGQYFDGVTGVIDDFSYGWSEIDNNTRNVASKRREAGQLTTYYVCCSDLKPNNFTFSPPAESCFEGWFAAAMGFDGFLRWAYNSWVENPVSDSRFRTWPAGDTYFVYPGARSSIRFERLIEGIQDFEKIRILRENLAVDPSQEAAYAETALNEFLNSINSTTLNNRTATEITKEGKKLVESITVILSGQ